jgi:predicted nucleic acid-binding protein
MKRYFMDASVLFAAAYSAKGYARQLLAMAADEPTRVRLVVSDDVLGETRRNLFDGAPEKIDELERLLRAIQFETVNPTRRLVVGAAKRVALKDAPIVAAARKAKVDALVTFDKKHLLGKPEIARYIRAEVIPPEAAVKQIEAT